VCVCAQMGIVKDSWPE